MKKTIANALVGAILATTFAAPALAQSGSRLCGWVASTPAGAIGILYEARKKDASMNKQCNKVISEVENQIKADANLSKLAWNKVDKASCEDVGRQFQSSNSPEDMCEKMEAKTVFQVQKSNKDNTTTYTAK